MSYLETAEELGLAAVDGAEAVAGELPEVGTAIHGAQSLYYSGKSAYDIATGADPNVAADDATNAGIHAAEAVPILGSFLGLGAQEVGDETVHDGVKKRLFGYDIPHTNDPHIAQVGDEAGDPDSGPAVREENPAPDVDRIHQANMDDYQQKLDAWNESGKGEKPHPPERAQAWEELDTPRGQARLAGLETEDKASSLFRDLF